MILNSAARSILSALALCTISFGITYAFFVDRKPQFSLIDSCFKETTDPGFASKCLRAQVSKLLETYTTRELMAYITSASSSPTVQSQCHATGHIIGEMTYEKYDSMEASLSQCTSACRASCIHGAVGAGVLDEMGQTYSEDDLAHADNETLRLIAKRYCENSDPLCHAIGHLAYLTNENLAKALSICDVSAKDWLRESCYQGVFMEHAGSSDSMLFPQERDASNAQKSDDYIYPCLNVDTQYRHACFQLLADHAGPNFDNENIIRSEDRLKKVVEVCSSLSKTDRAYCFEGIGAGSLILGFQNIHSDDIQSLCDRFEGADDRSACTLGILPRFFYLSGIRDGHSYCENIKEQERSNLCFNAAFRWDEARGRTTDPMRICGTYAPCLQKYAEYTRLKISIPDYRFGLFGN